MNPAILQTQLQQPYRRATSQGLLNDLLPGVEIFAQPNDFPLTNDRERSIATARRQFGRATLVDGKRIAFYEIDVAQNGVQLHRNRVALRQIIARCIDEVDAHAVLAFFVQPGIDAYRLTYAARESVINPETLALETRETATRRYTYVLGPGEPRRTASIRLAELAVKRTGAGIADVTKTFDVEPVSDEFFAKYKQHYQAFRDYLTASDAPARIFGITLHGLDEKEQDRALKPVRDFVKKLLGRLVFLHFLQKKGWLGCDASRSDWNEGDPQFLRTLFDTHCPDKNTFHSRCLVPLFFDTLNRPNRPGHAFAITGTRVPYLNGGLFERDFKGVERIDFPAALFDNLLEFFGQYHFTIDENDPDDHEIGIDPEMLGRIFENLLEDNKDKGAYYTPKPVVQYMCQQSLIHALAGSFPDEPAARGEIEKLIRFKDPIDARRDTWLASHATHLEEILDGLKICDPAIGSGAFPIGLLQEMFWTKLTLHPGANRAHLKRAIIQNAIHGVDLDAGAVEIARLRFWLALIVDEEEPLPLPNLDYQIMQGNSLLESFEGIDLSKLDTGARTGATVVEVIGDPQFHLLADESRAQMELTNATRRDEITALIQRYFSLHDPEEKAAQRHCIDALAMEHIRYNLAYKRDEIETQLIQQRETLSGRRVRPRAWTNEKCQRAIASLESQQRELGENEARLRALEHQPERPFFLWHLWFRDIFAEGGFDIVIANPPYGAELGEENLPMLNATYEVAGKRPDSFALFIELGVKIARASGTICMIVPNGWYSGVSFRPLRQFFAVTTDPSNFVNLPYDVFADAWVDTTIFLTCKRELRLQWPRRESIEVTLKPFSKRQRIASIADFLEGTSLVDFIDWFAEGTDEYLTFATSQMLAVLRKMQRNSVPLSENADVQRGVTPFHLTNDRCHANSMPAFSGTIRRYICAPGPISYIRYDESLAEFKPERYFRGPRLLLRELISRQFQLQAMLVTENFVTNKSMQSILQRNGCPDLRYLLGVLNSKAMSWFFLNRSNIAQRDDFPKIVLEETRKLPIPQAAPADQATLTALVDRILAAKQAGNEASVAALETEIDAHVYRLYNLTPEEIALIEGNNR